MSAAVALLGVVALVGCEAAGHEPEPSRPTEARIYPEWCSPLNCNGNITLGPYDPPAPGSLKPDSRPGKLVRPFIGNKPCTENGLAPWWYDATPGLGALNNTCDDSNPEDDGCICTLCNGPTCASVSADADRVNGIHDSVDELISRLTRYYDDGWRRLLLNRPAGNIVGAPPDMAHWFTMPEGKRDDLSVALADWTAAHPDATVGIYIGFEIYDPCQTGTDAQQELPDDTFDEHVCQIYNNLQPWIDAGITEIRLDNTGPEAKRGAFLRLAGSPDYTIRFGGEALPNEGSPRAPIATHVRSVPWIARELFYLRRFSSVPDISSITPREVGVGFQNGSAAETDCTVVEDYMELGYVPWSWHKDLDENVMRACGCYGVDGPCDSSCLSPSCP